MAVLCCCFFSGENKHLGRTDVNPWELSCHTWWAGGAAVCPTCPYHTAAPNRLLSDEVLFPGQSKAKWQDDGSRKPIKTAVAQLFLLLRHSDMSFYNLILAEFSISSHKCDLHSETFTLYPKTVSKKELSVISVLYSVSWLWATIRFGGFSCFHYVHVIHNITISCDELSEVIAFNYFFLIIGNIFIFICCWNYFCYT